MNRRTFITAVGTSVVSLAGCLGGRTAAKQDGSETTEAENPLGDHPAAVDLADQPMKGPDPASAPSVIIMFSDPSCPNCARFEDETVPKIESELVETGKATLVYRGMPIMQPWGEPALEALEATFDHVTEDAEDTEDTEETENAEDTEDAEAFWALKDHYYENREEFDTDNVFEKTESFLAENTDVDAEAVVSAAEAGEYDDAVQADFDVGEEAGVSDTPTSFLFKDGEHVTTVSGAKSYTVIAEALGY
jgi:protein-disulfide isomerase